MIKLKTNDWQIDDVETILFDKDGTFIDLHYFWGKMSELRSEEIIKKYNLDIKELDNLCLKLGHDRTTGKMLKDGITALYSRQIIIQIFTKELNNMRINITEKKLEEIFDNVNEIFYKDMIKYTKPIDSAIEFIKQVRKMGIKTGIVTSDSKKSTLLTLKHFSWENLFDVVIGRESTKETKESGVGIKFALELINANPKTSVMVGDAPMDYIAAKNGGVEKIILVSTGQIEKKTLLKTSKYCVTSLKEVNYLL